MTAEFTGQIIGYAFGQIIFFAFIAFILGAIVYFAKRKNDGFFRTVMSWKVLLAALIVVGLINMARLGATVGAGASDEPYTAPAQKDEIKAGSAPSGDSGVTNGNGSSKWSSEEKARYFKICTSSFAKAGENEERAVAQCGCVSTEAQKIYRTYNELEQAYTDAKGAPEILKQQILACIN